MPGLQRLTLSTEQLRPIVLSVLPRSHNTHLVFQEVANEAVRRGLVPNPIGPQTAFGSYALHGGDQMLVQDVLWALIVEGIIYPGMNASNPDLPWLHLTEYGRQVVQSQTPTPHDPDGFLGRLRAEVPGITDTILAYISESLRTFRINCLLASTITLGCASEEAILLLVEATASALTNQRRKENFLGKTQQRSIHVKFDQLMRVIEPEKPNMPDALTAEMDTWLIGIFNFIREQRNAAGHPTGAVVTRDQAYANFQIFVPYCKEVFALIEHLGSRPIP